MSHTILKAKNLHKSYSSNKEKLVILEDISLSLQENKTLSITGESGEGKTTLLHILASLDHVEKGEVYYQNKLITPKEHSYLRSHAFGMIFQGYNLFDSLSTIDNILLPARIAHKHVHKKSIIYEKALDLLDKVKILNKKNLAVKHLSGGEKQRVAIARSLINSPSIIFADEPTGNLDEKNSSIIHELLFSLAREMKASLIIVTHNQSLAKLTDHSFELKAGFLLQ